MLDDGSSVRAREVLIATGVVDTLPPVPGLAELYGKNVFHCPHCDGWAKHAIIVVDRSSDYLAR